MKIPETGESGLVIIPPPEIRGEIDMWRRVYRAYDSKITPHITIFYPFAALDVWDTNRRAAIDALRDIHAFEVKLRELGTFVRGESVLWLRPENGKALMKIHIRMRQLFSKNMPSSSLSYIPHLTIGFFDSVEELLEARKAVQKQLKPLQFKVDRIIYAIFEQEGWRIHDYINLQ
jgi:2'-5' RNA ligase